MRAWAVFRTVALSAFVVMCLIPARSELLADEPKLNAVLFVIDNLGWADAGCYGNKRLKTPHIDRLAEQGMRFTQAYAAAPVGLPTRAALMTGRYPQRIKMTSSFAADPRQSQRRLLPPDVCVDLPLSEVTVAELLKAEGYATGIIGKWNLGGKGFGPREQGFDLSIAAEATGSHYSEFAPYADPQGNLIPGLEQAPAGEYLTDRLAAETQKFIVQQQNKPFFLYLPHFAVHDPLAAKPELLAKYGPMPTEPKAGQINPEYAAVIESMDEAVGRVLKTLDELNLSQRTLVLLTSDNGGVCNDHGQVIPPTNNAPLRDGMGHLYEGGLRVPLIARWPGVIKAGSVNADVVSCIDLVPTIVDACRAAPSKQGFDGLSLVPVLKGEGLNRDAIYWHFPHYHSNDGAKPGSVIRTKEWKLIEFYDTGRRELFQVAKEPGEGANLIEQKADIVAELSAKLESWRQSIGAGKPVHNPNYTPNPQADDGSVMMHSSSAEVFGVMLRYEPLPHKDTLGYWVNEQDWAQFEFTLKRPGRYHVIPHVGCGTNGGSLVHFEVAGQTLPLTVPATGHFQNFVPQDLGIVELDHPGRYTLTIKPQRKEGVAVMDIRRLELKPVMLAETLPDLHLLEPFWRSKTVYRESVLFVQETPHQPATGKLLFPVKRMIAVHSANGRTPFALETDFTINPDGSQLVRKESSAIPLLKSSDLFMPKGTRPVWTGGKDSVVPCALPHKLGDPETHLLFDNGHWFHDQQVEVTYEAATSDWSGPIPKFDLTRLPKTIAKLRSRQKLVIAVSGDSISYGLNASGLVGAPPYMPMYPDLVAAQLRSVYQSEVELINRAVGGWSVTQGLSDLDPLLEAHPDLIVIAYGMNDVGRRDPDAYLKGIRQMIARIKAARPDAEIMLVATMVGNQNWTHTPSEMFPRYRDALAELCEPGIALVDLTSLWTEMLRRKRDCDLTGNGVNHPSDFGHRVYASALLSLLVDN